jgi:hypothetical protein
VAGGWLTTKDKGDDGGLENGAEPGERAGFVPSMPSTRNYIGAGQRVKLECSCEAEVVLALVLVGVHRQYTVRIVTKGESCSVPRHRRRARLVVKQARAHGRIVLRDAG